MPPVDVVRTYLEMTDPSQLRGKALADPRARIVRRSPCTVAHYRALYSEVGGPWHWRDRHAWSDDELASYLAQPSIAVWELLVDDASAGYVELRAHDDRSVEIVYFGLAPEFIGQGLGGALLTHGVEEAWRLGARRVWLHTCTLDSPRALPNYLARGFRVFREERYVTDIGVSA